MRTMLRRLGGLGLILVQAGCVHYGVADKPLAHWSPQLEKQALEQLEGDRSADLLVMLAFSGGGSRASAFSYGVLEELHDTPLRRGDAAETVLDEVDIISSVSGGSFTAAYFGMHGAGIFTDFETRFLRRDVEGALLAKMFNPINWIKLLSRSYGRSDIAAQYYDRILFDHATLSALSRKDAPLIVLNTTDLASGSRFPILPASFDVLCADYASYPVSRAVAASSAVPVVLSPITIENFAGGCGYQAPAWIAASLQDPELSERKIAAQEVESYLDRKETPWLHLVDGGVSDNLGLRGFYNVLNIASEPGSLLERSNLSQARHVVIVSVNAHSRKKPKWRLERFAPSLFEVVGSVSADQISRYSEDTIEIVRYVYRTWASEQASRGRPVTFHFVEVSFDEVTDDEERQYLNDIGTNFDLNDEQVDRLIAAGRKVLRESPEFQDFLRAAGSAD
jgi:NTE family protein